MARRGKSGSSDQPLPEWGSSAPASSSAPPGGNWEHTAGKKQPPRRKRRWVRRVAVVLVVLLVVVGAVVVFLPTIGSALAPGIIEGAAKGQIAGSVKVSRVDLSWRGSQAIGPVELRDEKGKKVGTFSATIPVGLLTVVTEQWWSKSSIDLGQVEVTGDLDVVAETSGESNLDRAIAPGPAATKPAAKSSGGGGGPDVIRGTVRVKDLNVTYTDKGAPAGSPTAAGIGLLKFGGDVAFTLDQAGGSRGAGNIVAKAKLAGLLKGAAGGAGSVSNEKLELNADVDVKQSASGVLERATAVVEVFGAPIDLVDGLAGFRGELAKSIGDRADVKVNIAGNLDALSAVVSAKAEGASADLSYKLADGVLSNDQPGRVSLRRTDFLAEMPSLRAKFAELGKTVRLDAGPSVDVSITSFNVPLPKEMLGGAAAGATKPGLMDLDLRAASIELTATIGRQTGSVALDALRGGAGGAGGGAAGSAATGASAGAMTPFEVQPLVITASAPALAGPVEVRAGTKATLEGKPAGDLSVVASAAGLLDEKGRLKPDSLKDLRARVDLTGTSTSLLQPVASMLSLPLEMAQDVGPTLDVALTANSARVSAGDANGASAGSARSLPPMDVTLKVTSRNINADVAVKVDEQLTTVGPGVSLHVGSAGPLMQRILGGAKGDGASGSMEIGGRGQLDVVVSDLSLDMSVLMPKAPADGAAAKPLGLDQIIQRTRARADVRIEDLSVTMIPAPPASTPPPLPAAGAPKGLLAPHEAAGPSAPPRPIVLSRATLAAMLKPGSEPRITLDAAMSHDGSPFTAAVTASAPASVLAKPGDGAKGAANPIDQLIGFKPTVRAEVKSVPRSILSVVPSLAGALDAGAETGTGAEAKRLVSSVLGEKVDVTVELSPDPAGGAQKASVIAQSAGGATAVVMAALRPNEANLQQTVVEVNLTPANTAGLLASLSAPAEPAAGAAPAKPPMTLAEPVVLRLTVAPYTLPLGSAGGTGGAGGVSPKWDAAPELVATLSTGAAVTVRNVSVSESNVAASLRGLTATARVPMANVMGTNREGAVIPATVTGELVRTDGGRVEPVAKLDVQARVPAQGGNLTADVKLTDVNTAAADSILGKSNYLVGALGERVQANVRVQQAAGAGTGGSGARRMDILADLESSRLKGASIRASMDAEVIRADSAKLTWTPSVEWVNENLLGGAEARKQNTPPAAVLVQETTFTLDLKKLVIAATKKEGERTVQGPLKPGVFGLDAALTSPGMVLRRPDGKTVRLEEIRATAASREAPGSIGFDVNIARVGGDGTDGSKPSRLTGSLDRLADGAGVVTADQAQLTADGNLDSLPTAIVDALGNQKGLIVDALGSILSVNLKAQQLSKAGGTLDLTASAPRVNARVLGKIENGTFIQTGPIEANISEIIEPLIARFAGGVPLVENVIKTSADEKGVIKAESFTFPADGKDMSKFNGVITVDLGTAQFEAQGFFNQLLKLAGGRRSGVVGRKIEPFTIRANRGVLTYDRFQFPLGEFTVETRGTVDLVKRQINVVTYVPLFALADETVGLLGAGGLLANIKILDRNTLVPIKVSGPLDKPKAQPDAETFLKENAARLVPDPKKILENPGKALEDLLKGPKKDK